MMRVLMDKLINIKNQYFCSLFHFRCKSSINWYFNDHHVLLRIKADGHNCLDSALHRRWTENYILSKYSHNKYVCRLCKSPLLNDISIKLIAKIYKTIWKAWKIMKIVIMGNKYRSKIKKLKSMLVMRIESLCDLNEWEVMRLERSWDHEI